MKKLIILCCFFFSGSIFSQTENELNFKSAVELYNNGNYNEAVNLFIEIINNGEHSDALYFNLGNSYYKLNDIPNSIYYFEKALKLNPNDKDIINNLSYSQNMLIDKIDLLPSNQLSDFLNYISMFFSIKQWLVIGIIFLYFFLILFVFYFFKRVSNTKKRYFTYSTILFCASIIFILTAVTKFENQNSNLEAIIFEKKIDLRTEPNYRSEIQFNLNEGTKVNIKEELDDWILVELSNGASGWMESKSIKKID
tara:strand:+ start:1971 stop:2729 length:759 start_codon:yes stop_codon:yes gene_type:complete